MPILRAGNQPSDRPFPRECGRVAGLPHRTGGQPAVTEREGLSPLVAGPPHHLVERHGGHEAPQVQRLAVQGDRYNLRLGRQARPHGHLGSHLSDLQGGQGGGQDLPVPSVVRQEHHQEEAARVGRAGVWRRTSSSHCHQAQEQVCHHYGDRRSQGNVRKHIWTMILKVKVQFVHLIPVQEPQVSWSNSFMKCQ